MPTTLSSVLPIVAALVLVLDRRPWRVLRTVVTIAHEGGHVVTAVLAGRRLAGMRLHSDASGLTVSRGPATGMGMVVMLLAGYTTPSLLGLGAALVVAAGRHQLVLAAGVGLLAALLVTVRTVFGVSAIVVTGAALAVAGFSAPVAVQRGGAAVLAWFLLFGGLRSIADLRRSRRGRRARDSDADQLARLTRVPAPVWVAVFWLVAAAAILAAVIALLGS